MKFSQWTFVLGVASRVSAGWVDGALLSSADGTCGEASGYTCYGSFFGNCCGSDGFCGSDGDVCGVGCQKDFGFCQETLTQPGHELSSGPSRDGPSVSDALPGLYNGPISCPADNGTLWYASNGDLYAIECGIDHHQGNLPHTGSYVPSVDACIELCSNTTNCVDAAWVRGSPQGACYLKSTVGGAFAKDNVYSGRLISKAPPVYTSIAVKTSAGNVASSTVLSTAVTTTSIATALPTISPLAACPAMNNTIYTDTCGAKYVIECGFTYSGGDIPGNMTYQPNLDACTAQCSKNLDCVAVSWIRGSPNGACYLKSVLGEPTPNAFVYGARQISGCVPITPQKVVMTSSKTSVKGSIAKTSTSSTKAKTSSIKAKTTSSAKKTSSTKKASSTKKTSSTKKQSSTLKSVVTSSTKAHSSILSSSTRRANSTAASTCNSIAAPTGSTLKNCKPCKGQPGNGKFCGFDVNTNSYKHTPITCNVVYYEFDITNTTIAPDGVERPALLVNGQMPGPTIRASWGDTVVVKVNNKMQNNGTSIHFHGIRQLNNNMNDGVVSVTQCPIAAGESFTYTWVAENYGTSWYHSHFGIQTYEGVFGPMIIDGPHSESFDQDLGTFVLQDWTHVTVDSMYDLAQNATPIPGRTDGATYGGPQTMDTGLINGVNVFGDDGSANQTGKRLELSFQPGKTYLLRLINTAIQSTFKFSIDGHTMTVISTDFVPIEPYETETLGISIGQRYNVIVKANAKPNNYWMRADNQESCAHTVRNRDIKAIVRYVNGPTGTLPSSKGWNYTDSCADEPMASLVPVLALDAGDADVTEGTFDVVVQSNSVHLYKWYISGTTFQSQYNDPPLLDIVNNMTINDYSGNLQLQLPEAGKMVYVVIESPIPLPHPLHLHGHDFWILASGEGSYDSSVELQLSNPPRRDTVSMPGAGYVVIAFETDNPGLWLFHCHIGWHTSMGLALTFMEMQNQIVSSGAVNNSCALKNNCNAWNTYSTANNLKMWDSGV